MSKTKYIGRRVLCVLTILLSANVWAIDELGGVITADINGKMVNFPILKTDVVADVQGDLATITITQVFANPTDTALHATYLFPMNKDAAVYAMKMQVGDDIVEAKIKRLEKAKKTFEKAKKKGKAAALLVQHRPNMFTQNIANLVPGLPITVTLQYAQTVPKVDGHYELVVPLIVGPRYQPQRSGQAPAHIEDSVARGEATVRSDTDFNQWEVEALPAYPHVAGLTIPKTIDQERVTIQVNLQAAVSIVDAYSDTHTLDITGTDIQKTLQLADNKTIDNRDFILRYNLAGLHTQAGVLAHKDKRGGFFSLLIEPPEVPLAKDIAPREMVFVLDTSGSMRGEPLAASKTFMRHALKQLRSQDYFRIIRFGNNASEFTAQPVLATTSNRQAGLAYVDQLDARGGTEIPAAIQQAFAVPPADATLRIVVFLTDGYIGNESEVLQLVASEIGNARIYAFGVGTSVNRYLLAEMGRMGRGFARFIDPTENADEVAIALAKKLEAPVLTDIKIDWGDLPVENVVPAVMPDLFAGDSIRVQGRYKDSGRHVLNISGQVGGRQANLPVSIDLPTKYSSNTSDAIALIWARSQIADYMRTLNKPRHLRQAGSATDKERIAAETELKEQVTQLGLRYSLVTRWTAFVAVAKQVINPEPSQTPTTNVPLPMVKGVTESAYPQFSGGAAPEPAVWAGLLIIALASVVALRRRPHLIHT